MTNYNWRHPDNVLELGIGVSCCPKPTEEMLSSIWARTRPGFIGLLNSLQGIHVFVSNINDRKAQVTIKEVGNDVKLSVDQFGHMWHLLAKGKEYLNAFSHQFSNYLYMFLFHFPKN